MPQGGAVRGAVVLCPPFGREAQDVGRTYRALGEQLAQQGLAALHIDYDGTGDSAGWEEDPGRLEAWQGSVGSAIELMRSSGARHVAVVAMRLGATVVASGAAPWDLDALVLWDPCESGRSYFREQALLRAVYLEDQGLSKRTVAAPGAPTAGPAPVETLGTVYPAATAKVLSQLNIESAPGPLAGRVLALFRPERPARPATLQRLEREHLELGEANGQEELLNASPLRGLVPQQTIGTVVDWLAEMAGPGTSPLTVTLGGTAVVDGPGGEELVEEIVALGPNQLFGILTRPRSGAPDFTVVLLNAGKLDHLGPGRLWVRVARSWAPAGMAVLRADLSGLGDSPLRAGRRPDVAYSPDALADIYDLVQAVSPAGPSGVALMGLCSGAYHAVVAGTVLRPRGVLAVNPVWPLGPAGQTVPGPSEGSPGASEGRGVEVIGALDGPASVLSAAKRWARRRLSYPWLTRTARWALDLRWWVVNRTSGRTRPALVLKRLAATGARTLVVCRYYDARLIARGEKGVFRRLRNQSGFRMEVVSGIDHSLYLQSAREAVIPILFDQVCAMRARAPEVSSLAAAGDGKG